jgi:hypothetical protein
MQLNVFFFINLNYLPYFSLFFYTFAKNKYKR